MAFFDDKQLSAKGIQPSDEDIAYALQLRNIAARAKLLRTNNPKKWANEFRLLRLFVQGDAKRIERVLNALAETNCKGFRICSAMWLRKNFLWIEGKLGLLLPAKLALTPLAAKVLVDIQYKTWRSYGIEPALLEQAVIESCNNYETFLSRLKIQREAVGTPIDPVVWKKCKGFAEYLWADLQHSRSIMSKWFEGAAQTITFWTDWNGSLVPFKFIVTHKRFEKMGRAYAQAYCGDPAYWNTFVGALGYED